ncbi:hypothetical protein [Methylobacterium nodulans]|uniref:Uncharacterized protein n=1 Tax=Methylobacterium nodulans (strain LMG 21967 / CNCM I-2342 / ORS 2060) TaxID=460265 RepID=B8IG93_METNO|nr:hypothetical protein [Methylobacterium nodulans]ACL61570.1 conserved hypothetical protein [Methylobacterium nodulans ORS 2060]
MTEPTRHRWFDDFRGAKAPRLLSLVQQVTAQVDEHEKVHEPRKHVRRQEDQRRHETAIEAIVANLAHAVHLPPELGRLACLVGNSTERRTRYDSSVFGKGFRKLLWRLEEAGVLDWNRSFERGQASTTAPTSAFAERVREAGVELSDFRRLPGEEVILLSQKTLLSASGQIISHKAMVDYADTPEIRQMRQTIREINAFLEGADISFIDDGLGPVDAYQRTMRRHFVLKPTDKDIRFDRRERLFGGFWQNLKRARRGGIRIGGEEAAILDFSSMFPRLAYASAGATPPEGDVYAIPGLENHRRGVKLVLSTLLFDNNKKRKSWPSELLIGDADTHEPSLPEGWTVKHTRAAIAEAHPPLANCLGDGLGYSLMHIESRILVTVLEELRARGIVALGLHDGPMAPWSRREEVKALMEDVGRRITSIHLPVEITSAAMNH